MAVSLKSSGYQDSTGTGTVSLDAVTNGILLVYVNCTDDLLSCTFDGNAMTKFSFSDGGGGTNQSCTGFYYLTSSAQASKTVEFTGEAAARGITHKYYQDAAQQSPQDVATATTGTANPYTQDIAVSKADSMVDWYVLDGAGTRAAGSGMTRDTQDTTQTGSESYHSTSVQAVGTFTATATGSTSFTTSIISSIQTFTEGATTAKPNLLLMGAG